MPKQRTTRLYTRERGGVKRYYGDFRDYADVDGKREPLIPKGEKIATSKLDIAQHLVAERVKELDAKRKNRTIHGVTKETTLKPYATAHLIAKKKSDTVTDEHIEVQENHLSRALDFLGDRELTTVTVEDVRAWMDWLQTLPNRRGGKLTGWTARAHLSS